MSRSLDTNTKLSHYRIVKQIGAGGMGEVYLAEDIKLERRVALKVLPQAFVSDARDLARFEREAKAASALNHPNIVTVHEFGDEQGLHFIATEFVEGETLRHRLSHGGLTLDESLEVASQIANAVGAAHSAGVVHRNLKPENVMIRNDGIVKVLDFGLAKVPDKPQSADLEAETRIDHVSIPGMIVGTPQYMSPEQARGQKVDARTDIFSFGIVLYEMLAGERPFGGATNIDTIGAILKDEPEAPSDRNPKIPPELDRLVEKSLRKDREQRYQHIKDLYIDINDIRRSASSGISGTRAPSRTGTMSAAHSTTSLVRERRFSLVHLFGVLMIVLAVGGLAWWRWPSPVRPVPQSRSVEITSWAANRGEIFSEAKFSPDGRMIAFSSSKSGSQQIWIKQTDKGDARQITNDEFRNDSPIWSPDGDELAYASDRGTKFGFWRMPVLGGSPRLVTELDDGSARIMLWAKNGLIYYKSKFDLYSVDVRTGEIKLQADLASTGVNAESIGVSSDGTRIAYVQPDGDQKILWLKYIEGSAPKKLFLTASGIGNINWHPDGRRIYFSSETNGVFQVFETDVNGKEPRQISFGDKACLVADISADGNNILYGSSREESDIWRVGVRDKKEVAVAGDIDSELWPDVSPNGKLIAYQSIKNLNQGNNLYTGRIYVKKLDSDDPPVEIAGSGALPVWSPDGESVAHIETAAGKRALVVSKAAGGQKQVLSNDLPSISYAVLPYNRVQNREFGWSSDSSSVAYVSTAGNASNIRISEIDGSSERSATNNADPKLLFYCPFWSQDNRSLAFTSKLVNADNSATYSLWLLDQGSKTARTVFQDKAFIKMLGWSADGKGILLASSDKREYESLPPSIKFISMNVSTGQASPVFSLKDAYLHNIFLSPDKKTIAFTAHRDGTDDIWTIPAVGGSEVRVTQNKDPRIYFSSLAWSPDDNFIYFGKQTRYSLLSVLSNFN